MLYVYQQIEALAGESKLLNLRYLKLTIDWSDEKQSIITILFFNRIELIRTEPYTVHTAYITHMDLFSVLSGYYSTVGV